MKEQNPARIRMLGCHKWEENLANWLERKKYMIMVALLFYVFSILIDNNLLTGISWTVTDIELFAFNVIIWRLIIRFLAL